jgi:hypothetical protein
VFSKCFECVCEAFSSSERSCDGTLVVLFRGGNIRSSALIFIVMLLGYCLVVVVSLVAPSNLFGLTFWLD